MKNVEMKELNKESKLYVECLRKGKRWMEWDEEWLKEGWGYKKKVKGVGGWCLFKNGELWRDGFKSESSVWKSLIGSIDLIVNMWDWGWRKRGELEEKDWNDRRVYDYMKEIGEECGVKVKVDEGRVWIEDKDYLRLRKEVSKDLGWEIKEVK